MDSCMNGGYYLGIDSSAADAAELLEAVIVRDSKRTTSYRCKGGMQYD
jgi:hypothetical protein